MTPLRLVLRTLANVGGWVAAAGGLAVAGSVVLPARRPELDLVAQFAAPALWTVLQAFVLVLAARVFRAAGAVLVAVIALTLALQPQLFPHAPSPQPGVKPLRIYMANLWVGNRQMETIARSIQVSGADVVALMEFGDEQAQASGPMFRGYGYRVEGPRSGWFWGGARQVIVSRYPIEAVEWRQGGGFAVVQARVHAPFGVFRLVVIHLTRPWPFKAPQEIHGQVSALTEGLRVRREPLLLVGDFNQTIAGPELIGLARRTGLRALPAPTGDWPSAAPGPLRIAIENAFASPELVLSHRRVGAANGSDHRPVVFEVGPARR